MIARSRERERHVRMDQRVERRTGVVRALDRDVRAGEQLVDDAFDERDEQLLLVAEVAVDRGAAHSCGGADVDDADGVEATRLATSSAVASSSCS